MKWVVKSASFAVDFMSFLKHYFLTFYNYFPQRNLSCLTIKLLPVPSLIITYTYYFVGVSVPKTSHSELSCLVDKKIFTSQHTPSCGFLTPKHLIQPHCPQLDVLVYALLHFSFLFFTAG